MSQSASSHCGAITEVEKTPLVTAIMVTRNQESFIREGLCSLMEQSVAHGMEVIVVDEGSEQAEWAVIPALQRSYPNLISVRTSGAAGLNLALKIASGRYLTVLEPSDRMNPDAYRLLTEALEQNPDAMLAYGDTCITAIPHESFAHHTSYGKMIWPDYTSQQLSHLAQVAPHPMWRRELHDTLGWFSQEEECRGMRSFLQKVAQRFRMIHLQEFTGLKLVTAAPPSKQSIPAPALSATPPVHPAVSPEQKGAPAAPQESRSAAHPEPSADQAYAVIQPLLKGDQEQQAIQALERHLARYPDHAIAHNDMAAISYLMGDKEKAIEHYRAAVRLSPEEGTYKKNLADLLYVEAGEVDEAIAIYLELHKSSPRDVETLLNLGIISGQVGQPTEAESFFQRALEIEPWNQAVRERLTELRERQAEPGPAQDQDDETAEERYERSQTLVARGELEGATRELEALIGHFPEFSPAHNDLAVLYYQTGAKDEALEHYEKAATLAPGNTTFQKNLADFYFVEGKDVDGAIAIYLDLLRKEPRNVETLMSLGKICTILDRPKEAETFYGKVTQLEPWNQDARECLSTLRQCANG